jgi:rRNA maturation endonuclease Nob1
MSHEIKTIEIIRICAGCGRQVEKSRRTCKSCGGSVFEKAQVTTC